MAAAPVVSVVVPTFGRAHRLKSLMDALERQDLEQPFEVVVVDDASPDDTASELEVLAGRSAVPVRVLRLATNHGPAVARNVGWRAARAPLIAFTDDDCTPQSGWLRSLVEALADAEFVQGLTVADPDQLSRVGPFTRTVAVGGENGFYETCNMGYRRHLLERLSGFDETYRRGAGEDADLGCRARRLGAKFHFEPDAIVHHDVIEQDLRRFMRNKLRWEGVVRMVHANPELKRFFDDGPFWLREHALAVAAGGGLLLAALARPRWLTSVLGAAAVVPYVSYRRRTPVAPGSSPPGTRHLPQVFAGDLLEACVHVVSRLRVHAPRAPGGRLGRV